MRRLLCWTHWFLVAACVARPGGAAAQSDPALGDLLPQDSAVTTGTLSNGLRYYIRANARPRDRAELRLVVDVGSIVEDDDQLGLAHFAEHMAFNGTRRFPKHALIAYLEGIGMRFGADINATTSFDQTIYQLTVPTDSVEVLHTAFDILEDWAHAVSFDPEEIELERGVVMEEWRLGRGAEARMMDRQFPILFSGSRYAGRLPIGSPDVLRQFEHDALRRFYRDWYRPDLMAVVAVGDFDAAAVEEMIRDRFAPLASPADPRPRPAFDVPIHDETLYAVATDREETSTTVALYVKRPVRPQGSTGRYREALAERLFGSVLNDRLFEKQELPDAPFLYASAGRAGFVRSVDAGVFIAGVRNGEAPRGLEALLTEAARLARHGVTPSELERAKAQVLRGMERAYAEREKTQSVVYAGEYVRHFIDGEPFPGIAYEYELHRRLLPEIGLDEVNAVARELLRDEGRVVVVSAPEGSALAAPTEAELAQVFEAVASRPLQPYDDAVADAPLLPAVPPRGAVADEGYLASVGVTDLRLANGVRVLLKPTDFQNDQVLLRATSPGGTSLAADEDYVAAMTASAIVSSAGVGSLSRVALQKALAGTSVQVFPEVYGLGEGVFGWASPRDVETMFQLVYLYFTAPRRDSSAFVAYRQRMQDFVRHRDVSPEVAFYDTLNAVLSQDHFRMRPFTTELFEEMDLDKSYAFYRDRFADAGDFTFVVVGSFSVDSVRPLVETYLGSLPSNGRRETWRDRRIIPPAGVVEKVVRRGVEPRSQTQIVFTGLLDDAPARRHELVSLTAVLQLRLRDRLREALGGTYGASVTSSAPRVPEPRYSVHIRFGSDPDRVDELVEAVFDEIARLQAEGPSAEDLAKVRESQRRARETSLRENGFWLDQLSQRAEHGLPLDGMLGYDALVDGLAGVALRDAARALLRRDTYVLVTLVPETVN